MKVLRFYGRGDDLLTAEVNGELVAEASAFGNGGAFLVRSREGALRVTGHYGAALTSCWAIGITLQAENEPIPNWPMRYTLAPAEGYPKPSVSSPMLTIEVPDDAVIIEVTE